MTDAILSPRSNGFSLTVSSHTSGGSSSSAMSLESNGSSSYFRHQSQSSSMAQSTSIDLKPLEGSPNGSEPLHKMPRANQDQGGAVEESLNAKLDAMEDLLTQELRPDGVPKRPMNAFLIYARYRRSQMLEDRSALYDWLVDLDDSVEDQGAQSSGTRKRTMAKIACRQARPADVSAALGTEWKRLSAEQQEPFHRKAHQLRVDFDARFPDYRFTRGPKGVSKQRKQDRLMQQRKIREARQQGDSGSSVQGSRSQSSSVFASPSTSRAPNGQGSTSPKIGDTRKEASSAWSSPNTSQAVKGYQLPPQPSALHSAMKPQKSSAPSCWTYPQPSWSSAASKSTPSTSPQTSRASDSPSSSLVTVADLTLSPWAPQAAPSLPRKSIYEPALSALQSYRRASEIIGAPLGRPVDASPSATHSPYLLGASPMRGFSTSPSPSFVPGKSSNGTVTGLHGLGLSLATSNGSLEGQRAKAVSPSGILSHLDEARSKTNLDVPQLISPRSLLYQPGSLNGTTTQRDDQTSKPSSPYKWDNVLQASGSPSQAQSESHQRYPSTINTTSLGNGGTPSTTNGYSYSPLGLSPNYQTLSMPQLSSMGGSWLVGHTNSNGMQNGSSMTSITTTLANLTRQKMPALHSPGTMAQMDEEVGPKGETFGPLNNRNVDSISPQYEDVDGKDDQVMASEEEEEEEESDIEQAE